MNVLDNYLAINGNALTVRNERMQLIAENIANESTPNFKAKDLDFAKAMAKFQAKEIDILATDKLHIGTQKNFKTRTDDALVYRIPLAPSLDNNTVELSIEQANYGKAAAQYQASLQFLESRISGLRKALRGE
jgi:flagellar basal-body rod protein FlgB